MSFCSISVTMIPIKQIKAQLTRGFFKMYSSAFHAFTALDYTGLGFVTKEAFVNSMLIKNHLRLTPKELEPFFKHFNIFMNGNTLKFEAFKKLFFPNQSISSSNGFGRDEILEDNKALINSDMSIEDKAKVIEKRIRELDEKIKI